MTRVKIQTNTQKLQNYILKQSRYSYRLQSKQIGLKDLLPELEERHFPHHPEYYHLKRRPLRWVQSILGN